MKTSYPISLIIDIIINNMSICNINLQKFVEWKTTLNFFKSNTNGFYLGVHWKFLYEKVEHSKWNKEPYRVQHYMIIRADKETREIKQYIFSSDDATNQEIIESFITRNLTYLFYL
jgi:hypothetical protein